MDRSKSTPRDARAYVLGGNAGTLAYLSSMRADNRQITVYLVPLAWTPIGVVIGQGGQQVHIAADNISGWVDQTFAPDDDRAFVSPLRDLEMLSRVGWHAEPPNELTEPVLLNPEDLPEDVLDGIEQPAQPLLPCAVCRRICVRDHFVWNDRQLCAWDYHAMVFGKRGPWRGVPYEDRFFETLPRAPYMAPPLLDEINVEPIMSVNRLPEATMQRLVNLAIEEGGEASYLAVRMEEGLSLLRERSR